MLRWLKEVLQTEFGAMCLVVILYLLKVPAKLALGVYIHSPVIYGDAWHNIVDMAQSLLVIGALFFAGISKIAVNLVLAVGLIYTARDVGLSSWGGILQNFPIIRECVPRVFCVSAPHLLVFGQQYLDLILIVLVLGALLSLAVGSWQIRIGQNIGNDNVVLNGKETIGDSAIEFAVLLGIVGEYFFTISWLEYPLGLVIATALFCAGLKTLYNSLFVN
ncbi:MAG: cation transporter [Candidatus Vogelbacteria bacterium]|nr:cation transporter [Candidatus Vogelbacteria bacterium]